VDNLTSRTISWYLCGLSFTDKHSSERYSRAVPWRPYTLPRHRGLIPLTVVQHPRIPLLIIPAIAHMEYLMLLLHYPGLTPPWVWRLPQLSNPRKHPALPCLYWFISQKVTTVCEARSLLWFYYRYCTDLLWRFRISPEKLDRFGRNVPYIGIGRPLLQFLVVCLSVFVLNFCYLRRNVESYCRWEARYRTRTTRWSKITSLGWRHCSTCSRWVWKAGKDRVLQHRHTSVVNQYHAWTLTT